jgi:hypothetical protein
MHFLGLRIASTCDELTLVQIAGTAGTVMFSQSRSGAARAEYGEPRPVPTKPKVTLASLPSLHS